jgi:hypothetical protein
MASAKKRYQEEWSNRAHLLRPVGNAGYVCTAKASSYLRHAQTNIPLCLVGCESFSRRIHNLGSNARAGHAGGSRRIGNAGAGMESMIVRANRAA